MSPTSSIRPNNSTYIVDVADRLEYVRQADVEQLFAAETGGLFPEQFDSNLPGVKRILDVACGTGNWVLNVAFDYPNVHIVGIDSDPAMGSSAGCMKKLIIEELSCPRRSRFTALTADLSACVSSFAHRVVPF